MMFAQGTPLEDIQAAESAWLNPQYGGQPTAMPIYDPMVQQPMDSQNFKQINRLLSRQSTLQGRLDALDPSKTGRIGRINNKLTRIGDKLAGLGYVPNAPQPVANPSENLPYISDPYVPKYADSPLPYDSTYMDNFTPPPGLAQQAQTPGLQNTFGNPFMNLYANQGIQSFSGLGMQSGGLSDMSAYNMSNPFLSGNYNFSPFGV